MENLEEFAEVAVARARATSGREWLAAALRGQFVEMRGRYGLAMAAEAEAEAAERISEVRKTPSETPF